MSDHAIIVCELSTTATNAQARADAVEAWLLAREIIAPNGERDAHRQPSQFLAGAKASEVAPDFADAPSRTLANQGVDIVRERKVHHAIGNDEPPCCPTCNAPASEERFALLRAWLEGEEPALVCAECGASTPLGDWAGDFSACVAEIAVRFNNWPSLTTAFLEELSDRLGPRSRVVYEHI